MSPTQRLNPHPRRPIYVARPALPPRREFDRLLDVAWKRRWLTNDGVLVRRLERQLARYLEAPRIATTTNGTIALQLALRAVSERRGVVLTTPFTYAATTTALLWEGFIPRFVDIDPETFNLNPEAVAAADAPDVVGVLAVHVFGNPAGGAALARWAKQAGRWLIFDAAHAFGTRSDDGPILRWGDASTLSFHATKTFHTLEGGAVSSPRVAIDRRVRQFRTFGFEGREQIRYPGINGKMTEAQAAMGLANLRYVDGWIRARTERYHLYRDLLEGAGVEFQRMTARRPSHPYMPVLLKNRRRRDAAYAALAACRIFARKYFYPPTNEFRFARSLTGSTPVARQIASRVLTLPLYPDLPLRDVREVARVVRLCGAA
jgi:dTDP-4-amino-4,6-dideoxygalactose transaminase